ncbi:MAG: hypothetical protein A2Z31_04130 [candidate division NC10 bacterium RBG_16_65_8]|nr:MAG: hypothetical protein A2Z31_04130 [candidate division NC10 bacterium RBG_16_65_8]
MSEGSTAVAAIVNAGSALLGAGVGGVIAYFASMKAARYTMDKTASRDRERREEERAEMHQLLAKRLLAEMRENIAVLANPKPEWGCVVALHDAWDLVKGQVPFPAPVAEAVGKAYTEVAWYNTVVAGALIDHATFERIRSFTIVEDRAKKAPAALQSGMAALEAHLGETQPT